MTRLIVTALFLLTVSLPLQARQLVLVQGYLSSPNSWTESGIAQLLLDKGWGFGGELDYSSSGVQSSGAQDQNTRGDRFYQVRLPTAAPFRVQGHYLKAYLRQIRQRFPDDKLIVVGHSAGGVLARYVMVTAPEYNVDQLITIASPHLGSDTAELGKLIGDSPLALFAPMIGAESFTRSQALYEDLLPEQPGRFLYWLNRQPHPPAEYIAIARDQAAPHGGDWVVSQHSQHLEHVYALRHQAYSYVVAAGHQLTHADGRLIMDLINETRLRHL